MAYGISWKALYLQSLKGYLNLQIVSARQNGKTKKNFASFI